jgi:hypothetical protein
MNPLEARKKLLLAQSQLHRLTLAMECEQVQKSAIWLDYGYTAYHALRPAWPLLAPLAGYAVSRKWGMLRRVWVNALLGVGLARKVYRIWRVIQAR